MVMNMWHGQFKKIDSFRWKIPKTYNHEMNVPGIIFASEHMIDQIKHDNAPEQVANVATLPGIVKASMAMPDIHWGYGFPIGGVAAFDAEEGVVSPGGVGYDINCLSPKTKILTENGYWIELKNLPKKLEESVRIYNVNEGHNDSSDIYFVSEREIEPHERAMRIITETGKIIEGSDDHPVLTPHDYKMLGDMNVGDEVIVYPFEGVKYEERTGIILDERDFKDIDIQIVKYLRERNLIPLRWKDPKLGIIVRILGFAFGDGHLGELSDRITLSFYGKEHNLRALKKDIERLGVKCSMYVKEKVHHEEMSKAAELRISSRGFAVLLGKLGMPLQNKAKEEYRVPEWIMTAPLWLKRNFLAGLFGADGNIVEIKRNTPLPLNLTQGKMAKRGMNLSEFMGDVAKMLFEFGIKTTIYEIKSKGDVVYRLSIVGEKHIKEFLGTINYEYDLKKKEKGLFAYAYLLLKDNVKKERKRAAKIAREVYIKTGSVKEAYDSVRDIVNGRFVERAIYEKVNAPGLPENFPSFDDFISERGFTGGFVVEKVTKIERIQPDYMKFYDVGISHEAHNFISNGVVVHNCGVRLVRTNLREKDVKPKLKELIDTIFLNIPSGVGEKGKLRLSHKELNEVLDLGVKWAVEQGYGWHEDIERIEEGGSIKYARNEKVSDKAKKRGSPQLGTLGAGNHFLEIQKVDKILMPDLARKFGIEVEGQIMVMIHTGSRGLGHQVATEHIRVMESATRKYGIKLVDRQLACAPVKSKEANDYFAAMSAAANFGFTNRQLIMHWIREAFGNVFREDPENLGMHLVYGVAHNIAKLEEHMIDGKRMKVYVHRKGATRAFAAGREELSTLYRDVGQPVLIPGDMGTASYILVGTQRAMEETFGSTCHGAGRVMSRHMALRKFRGEEIKRELWDKKGIYMRSASNKVAAEEAPDAYKNIDDVVHAVEGAGISRIVARMIPLGVVKG